MTRSHQCPSRRDRPDVPSVDGLYSPAGCAGRGPAAAGVDQEEDVEDEVAAVVDEDVDDVDDDDDSLAPPVDEDEDDEVAAPFEELAPDRESVR